MEVATPRAVCGAVVAPPSTFHVCFLLPCLQRFSGLLSPRNSDSPSAYPAENHYQDYLAVWTNSASDMTAIDDLSATNPTHRLMLCEQEVKTSICDHQWMYYKDDGSEGRDSCIWMSNFLTTVNEATYYYCPANSHLLTIKGSSKTSGLMALATASGQRQNFYIGCLRDAGVSGANRGWSWVDNTPADNLNCGNVGDQGCGLWTPGNPRFVSVAIPLMIRRFIAVFCCE
jgi:hypothetical protein